MTENYYRIRNYKPDYSTFGGKVYEYDFCHMTMSDIAGRIISDWKFDEKCKKNAKEKGVK